MEPRSDLSKDDRLRQSQRILGRVNDEMQVSGLGTRLEHHFAAREADQSDRVEVMGRRIGRALSLLLCLGLIVWLALFVLQRAI